MNIRKLNLSPRATAVAAILAAAASAASAQDGVSAKEIVIGATTTLTGAYSPCGGVTTGAAAWFKKVNDSGGVHGRKIRYEVLDDGYSAQRAIANVRRLVGEEKIFALVAGCGSTTAAAVLTNIEKTDVPYLFPLAGNEALVTPVKKNVFSLVPDFGVQAATMLDLIAKDKQIKSAALSMINIAGHEAWMQTVRDKLKSLNIELVDEQVIDGTAADKAPFVTKIKSKNPDLAILMDSAPGGGRYLIEMQRQNYKAKAVTGFYTFADDAFLRAAGSLAEGVVAPTLVLPPIDPRAKECVDALAAFDKSTASSSFSLFGCAAAKVFVDALQRSGPQPTRAKLVAELEKTSNFDTGISGPVSFSSTNHQGLTALYALGVKDGKFNVIGKPLNVAR